MNTPIVDKKNPYVGPRPLIFGEHLYGRERETSQLFNLLVANRIVVLHSPSGAGKTSLIQAALIPRIQGKHFHLLPVARVNQAPEGMEALRLLPGFNRFTLSLMLSLEEDLPQEKQLDEAALVGMSLDAYLKRREEMSGNDASLMLILDQFEEILTIDAHNLEAKRVFFTQLGHALENQERWALLSLREDYLGALDPYLPSMPTGLNTRYRLDLLGVNAAKDAIQKPAADAGVEFTIDAVTDLVDDLRSMRVISPDGSTQEQGGPYVEPVQLQVVCQAVWDKPRPDPARITAEDLSGLGQVDDTLADYYTRCIQKISEQRNTGQRHIRQWIDRVLITPQGIRSQVIQDIPATQGLDNTVIQDLIDVYLVREEKRRGVTFFELAHDRLIRPIRLDNEEWYRENLSLLQRQAEVWEREKRRPDLLLREAALKEACDWADAHGAELTDVEKEFLQDSTDAAQRAEEERQRQAQDIKLQEQTRLAKRLRLNLTLAVGAFIVALALLGVAFVSRQDALSSAATANAASTAAFNSASTAGAERGIAQVAQQRAANSAATATANLATAVVAQQEADRQKVVALGAEATARAVAQEMQRQAVIAQSNQIAFAAKVLAKDSPQSSLLMSIEAINVTSNVGVAETSLARQSLYDSLGNAGGIPLAGHTSSIYDVEFNPDGRWLGTASSDYTVRVWDMEQATQPYTSTFVLGGFEDSINQIAFSPDGRWLAVRGSYQLFVLIWDLPALVAAGQARPNPEQFAIRLDFPEIYPNDLAFSPDGRWLGIGFQNGVVQLWDVQTGSFESYLEIFNQPEAGLSNLAFSPDGRWLAASFDYAEPRLWDVTAEDPRATEQRLLDIAIGVNDLEFDPTGRWLAGTSGSDLFVWDVSALPRISSPTRLTGHTDGIRALAFSPDGNWLASGSYDKSAHAWDLTSIGSESGPTYYDLTGHTDTVWELAYSPDGKWLATGSDDRSARLWQLDAFSSPTYYSVLLKGHETYWWDLAFSPDGSWLATATGDVNARLWELDNIPDSFYSDITYSAISSNLPGSSSWYASFDLSPDGRWLATSDYIYEDQFQTYVYSIKLWEITSTLPSTSTFVITGFDNEFNELVFSPDNQWLAGRSYYYNEVWLIDISVLSSSGKKQLEAQDVSTRLTGHTDVVTDLAFSPDGRWLASSSSDGTVRLWDLTDARQSLTSIVLGGYEDVDITGGVAQVVLSPDGHWLAVRGNYGDGIRLWDFEKVAGSGERRPDPEQYSTWLVDEVEYLDIYDLAFSPDGRWLASGSSDGYVRAWDLEAIDPTQEMLGLSGHTDYVADIEFNADGSLLASASPYDYSIRLWDFSQADITETVKFESAGSDTLIFTPDERWLASSSYNQAMIQLWGIEEMKPGISVDLTSNSSTSINQFNITVDGRWFVTLEGSGVISFWIYEIDELTNIACLTAGRNLRQEEWDQYFPGEEYRATCPQWESGAIEEGG